MTRRSSASKQANDKMKKTDEAPTSYPREIDDIQIELEPSDHVEPVPLKSETNDLATKPSGWARFKNWLSRTMKWLAVRPAVWLAIVILLFVIYLTPLSIWQRANQDKVQAVMQTATAQALQTAMPTLTPTP
jgi:hypothetical protein